MTPEQFAAIAKLTQSKPCASQTAARLVLVDGYAPADAARSAGCTPQAASNALRRFRAAQAVIDGAWGAAPSADPGKGYARSSSVSPFAVPSA